MKITYIYIILVALIIAGLIVVKNNSTPIQTETTSNYDSFAECLGNAGTKFYGAFWCPHCKDQKDLFENSKKLPYIECSLPNQQGQTKECIDAGITGYPTWEFADGSRVDGLQELASLSEKTNCPLPTQ